MKIFGITLWEPKALSTSAPMTTVSTGGSGWFGIVKESFGGAWQRGIEIGGPREVMTFSAIYACVTIIASDIAKLRVKLMELLDNGIGKEVERNVAIFTTPNHCQNRMQFFEQWIISKLLYGNTYILKSRDAKGKVVELYVLDPKRVTVLVVSEGEFAGNVYYRLDVDYLSGVSQIITVPASEIIHDRMNCLWHPLVGVSPIYACGFSATQGQHIQKNSTKFFRNMSRPSGALTGPGTIDDITASRMKREWEENFSGENLGRLAVLGDGLKYEPMTIPANEAQLIEQLKWTVEDVARCFHVPLYKLGGAVPASGNLASQNQGYYSDCLQPIIEALELCLDAGLGLTTNRYTEFDLEALLRMDAAARYEAYDKAIGSFMKPNEARAKEDLPPVTGGDEVYLQQQNYSLTALAKRDAKEDPFATTTPQRRASDALHPAPEDDEDEDMTFIADLFVRGLRAEHHVGA